MASLRDWLAVWLERSPGSGAKPAWATHVLPLELRPPLQTYLHEAHLLGLLPPAAARWLWTAYYTNVKVVNVDPATAFDAKTHPSPKAMVDHTPYVGPYSCPESGLFRRVEWTDDWPHQRPAELAQRVYAALADGAYLQLHINELFLRGSANWRQAHNRHQTLAYGYDRDADAFLCAGYDRAGEYGQLRLPRRLLAPALLSAGGRERAPYFAKDCVAELRPEPIHARSWPTAWLRQQLVDFCESRCSHWMQPDAVYGRAALQYLRLHFQACAERNLPADRKITRFLWEMARGMESRLSTLAGEEFSLLENYTAVASDLEKLANRLHLKTHATWIAAEKSPAQWGFLAEYGELLQRQESLYEELAGAWEMLG